MDHFQVNAEEQDLWHSRKLLRQGSYFSIRANINKACEKTSAALQYQKLQKRLHYSPKSPYPMVSPTCRDFYTTMSVNLYVSVILRTSFMQE